MHQCGAPLNGAHQQSAEIAALRQIQLKTL
jgi:hypothetical protein